MLAMIYVDSYWWVWMPLIYSLYIGYSTTYIYIYIYIYIYMGVQDIVKRYHFLIFIIRFLFKDRLSTRSLCLIVIRGNRSCLLRNMGFVILCLHPLSSMCFIIFCLHPLLSVWRSLADINKWQLPFPLAHTCVQHLHNRKKIVVNSQSQ